jgi:uncharacterized protein YdiU (UPF0061 family)
MTIEEYKEFIVQKLGTASDCEETEQIISRFFQLLREKHIPAKVKADYLVRLKDGLKQLSSTGFDYIHWCNIQCAILYLRKLTNKDIRNE